MTRNHSLSPYMVVRLPDGGEETIDIDSPWLSEKIADLPEGWEAVEWVDMPAPPTGTDPSRWADLYGELIDRVNGDYEVAAALFEGQTGPLDAEEAIEVAKFGDYSVYSSPEDYAQEQWEGDYPPALRRYIDWKAISDEMRHECLMADLPSGGVLVFL